MPERVYSGLEVRVNQIATPLVREGLGCPFVSLDDAVRAGFTKHWPVLRESARNRKRQMKKQLVEIVQASESRGCEVILPPMEIEEPGRLAGCGPKRQEAGRRALEEGLLLVFADKTRAFRPDAYHPRTNHDAIYTALDYARANEVYGGAPLATVMDPNESLAELHRMKVVNAEGCGRPSKFNGWSEEVIRERIGKPFLEGRPLRYIAESNLVDKSTLYSWLKRPSRYGCTWLALFKFERRALLNHRQAIERQRQAEFNARVREREQRRKREVQMAELAGYRACYCDDGDCDCDGYCQTCGRYSLDYLVANAEAGDDSSRYRLGMAALAAGFNAEDVDAAASWEDVAHMISRASRSAS
jgi:hypothetical protein